MKTYKKALSVMLGTTMLLSSVSFLSGCNSAKNAKKISADSPWYDTSVVNCVTGREDEEFEYGYFEKVCAFEDRIVTIHDATREYPPVEEISEDFDYSSLRVTDFIEYDLEGNIVFSQDVSEMLDGGWISSMFSSDDGITLIYSNYNPITYEDTYYTTTFDIDEEEFSEPEKLEFDTSGNNMYFENLVPLSNGALLFSIYTYEGDTPSYIFNIVEDGNIVKTIDFSKDFNQEIYDMQTFFNDENGNLISLGSAEEGALVYKLDVNTYEITDMTPENSADMDFYSYHAASDGCLCRIDNEGIKKLNTTTFEEEDLLSFNSCNVNLYDITGYSVVSVSDDCIVLTGIDYQYDNYMSSISTFTITTLTKADKNPNAGKINLEIGLVDSYVNEALADAIYHYNETSTECFASVKTYNSYDRFENTNDMTDDEFQKAYTDASAAMTNDLAIELMSGEGPDIIMDAATYMQLNNSDYLKDLSDVVEGLDSSSYFMNVFDAAKTGDKIYQIPLSFDIEGIACETKYAPSNGIGFTLPEYKEFVDTVCNGSDPKLNSRAYYFSNGICEMSDLFIDSDNNKVNFCQDAFYEFAEYCLNNVPETIDWSEYDYVYEEKYSQDTTYATAASLYSISSFMVLAANGDKEIGLYGVGADGRGPSIMVYNSVAVSASCASYDGALEFINLLLGEDIQERFAKSYSNCVNIDALENASLDIIKEHNADFDRQIEMGFTEEELMSWGMRRLDDSMIDDYVEVLSNGSYIAAIDPAVTSIILEEIPAYFAGQKSIEDVASIINNRAQTVLNER